MEGGWLEVVKLEDRCWGCCKGDEGVESSGVRGCDDGTEVDIGKCCGKEERGVGVKVRGAGEEERGVGVEERGVGVEERGVGVEERGDGEVLGELDILEKNEKDWLRLVHVGHTHDWKYAL